MRERRFIISSSKGTMDSTNNDRHALKLAARVKGDVDDTRPDPKYRWLREDILEAKH